MQPRLSSNKGFTLVEILLIILIVLIVVFGAYYIWHNHKNKTSNSQVNSNNSSQSTEDSAAQEFVSQFYAKYEAGVTSTGFLDVVQQYGTSNLVSYFNTYRIGSEDPIVCSQATPTSQSVTVSSINSSVTTLSVKENFGNQIQSLVLRVINQNGSLKIDSITCPQPLSANGG